MSYPLFQSLCVACISFFVYEQSIGEIDPALLEAIIQRQHLLGKGGKHRKLTPEQADAKRKRIWINIAKKEIPKVSWFSGLNWIYYFT